MSTLDHLTEGRFIFGVGVGGEFPKEYELCGVPREERGARLTEQLRAMRALWTGEKVSFNGKHYGFADVEMRPPSRQLGGPPIWCGGQSAGALHRTGRLGDGYYSYVVAPEMYREALRKIAEAAAAAGRTRLSASAPDTSSLPGLKTTMIVRWISPPNPFPSATR